MSSRVFTLAVSDHVVKFSRVLSDGSVIKNPPANAGDMNSLAREGPTRRGAPSLWVQLSSLCSRAREPRLLKPEVQPVHPKGDQYWVFTGRTETEAETPILWPPDGKNQLIGKDPDAGTD